MKHYACDSPFHMVDKEGNKYLLTVEFDEYAESPREAWDNVATMVCWHRRYTIGDRHDFDDPSDFWEWIEEHGGKDNFCIMPINMYEHSGITISTSNHYPYNDRWDAGCVGYIYVSKETAMREWGGIPERDKNGELITVPHEHADGSVTYSHKYIPISEENWREVAEYHMDGEVKVYDQYLRNEVYTYTLEEVVVVEEICPHCGEIISSDVDYEEVESYSGFYGYVLEENGILDEIGNLEFVGEELK